MQDYFLTEHASITEKKFLFLLRTCGLKRKVNRKSSFDDLSCDLCGSGPSTVVGQGGSVEDPIIINENCDSQEHLIYCEKLTSDDLVSHTVIYNDLFSEDLEKQLFIARVIKFKFV